MTDDGASTPSRFSTGKLLVLAVLGLLLLAGLMTFVSPRDRPTYRVTAYLHIKADAGESISSKANQFSQVALLQQSLPSESRVSFPGGGEIVEICLDGRRKNGNDDVQAIESAIAAYLEAVKKQQLVAADAKNPSPSAPPKVEARVIQPPKLTPIISRFPF